MRIAVCFSGHLRGLSKCHENINQYLLNPLRHTADVDVFCSVWDNEGFRDDTSTILEDAADFQCLKYLSPKSVVVEKNRREEFTKEYAVKTYYPGISCFETSGDATSMWYKGSSVFSLLDEKYDLVIRTRFDLLYSSKVNLQFPLKKNTVYMPISHGFAFHVTMGMMDQFSYGDYESMKVYFSTFSNIRRLIDDEIGPFTAEGFLYNTLKDKVNLVRVPMSYYLQRKDHIQRVV